MLSYTRLTHGLRAVYVEAWSLDAETTWPGQIAHWTTLGDSSTFVTAGHQSFFFSNVSSAEAHLA